MSDNEILFVRSSKKTSVRSNGDSSNYDDDIWDDTILIETYDKAVQLAQQGYLKKKQPIDINCIKGKKKGNEFLKWKVGDKCRCQYSEDMNYYEAEIVEILNCTGMCIVQYIGYDNKEKIPLKKLKSSEGDKARSRQLQQALKDHVMHNGMEIEDDISSNPERKSNPFACRSPNKKKEDQARSKNGIKKTSQPIITNSFPLSQTIGSIIPPPPPPHMFNNFSDDENEKDAMSAMLISWYMSGYHTGYYQGMKMAKSSSSKQ